ncbi:hypothetical protein FRB90_004026 [Tulasnella sp. 427]|nr:hypothetical protein FRB90_004026 [Tulasnella sp. 427]
MSQLDFSEDDLVDVVSMPSTTTSGLDSTPDLTLSPEVTPVPDIVSTPSISASKPDSGPTLTVVEEHASSPGVVPVIIDQPTDWRDPRIYYSRLVSVQVEDTKYRVPYGLIQQSEAFGSQITADDVLHVDGITTSEMEAFLQISDVRCIDNVESISFEQWAGALAIANRLLVPRI